MSNLSNNMDNSNSIEKPVYLDYAATTPIDHRVLEKMLPYMQEDGIFGNAASSTHLYGWQAKEAVSKSRRRIAKLLGVESKEIVFTSGATESDNLAIIGVAEGYASKGKHIITSLTEHKAVLDSCKYLETRGFDITYLVPQPDGLISLEQIQQAIRSDTILISIMFVNNETGVVQDIPSIGKLAKEHNILFHVDAVQGIGKLELNIEESNIDLMSISGHKIYGPKGIGALYVRRKPRINLQPQMHGGAHEFGFRSGTLATHQIVGLAYALMYSMEDMETEQQHLRNFEQRLLDSLNMLGGIKLNAPDNLKYRKPGHINVCVEGVEGEALIASLNKIAVSSGSACNSAVASSSHVLKAMQVPDHLARAALRITMGRFTTEQDLKTTISHLTSVITKLREISPVEVDNTIDNTGTNTVGMSDIKTGKSTAS